MNKFILPAILLLSMNVQAKGMFARIGDSWVQKYGTISEKIERGVSTASEECVKFMKEGYELSDKIVDGCNMMSTVNHYKCLTIIAGSNSQMHPGTPLACSFFETDESIMALKELTASYNAKISYQASLSTIVDEEEVICIRNKMEIGQLNLNDLESKCLKASAQELDQREEDILGFVITSRIEREQREERDGRLLGRVQNFFDDLF